MDAWFPTVLKSKCSICTGRMYFSKRSMISNGFSCSTSVVDISMHSATFIFGKTINSQWDYSIGSNHFFYNGLSYIWKHITIHPFRSHLCFLYSYVTVFLFMSKIQYMWLRWHHRNQEKSTSFVHAYLRNNPKMQYGRSKLYIGIFRDQSIHSETHENYGRRESGKFQLLTIEKRNYLVWLQERASISQQI